MNSHPQFDPATMIGLAGASPGRSDDNFDIFGCANRTQSSTQLHHPHLPLPTISHHPAHNPPGPPSISLIPYIRRLVATGMDFPGVLHGFFGDDWGSGVGPIHEQERRNYLFAAKSGGWASVKKDYDMPPLETIPFLRPLQGALDAEIETAERSWSEWLAMEDWMVGPRAPDIMHDSSSQNSRPRSARG
ncbi:hypothetical protein N7453_006359 [Penicillium expansum]|nr:hypothetical protein N7453_006359 [Penicillium expansum]